MHLTDPWNKRSWPVEAADVRFTDPRTRFDTSLVLLAQELGVDDLGAWTHQRRRGSTYRLVVPPAPPIRGGFLVIELEPAGGRGLRRTGPAVRADDEAEVTPHLQVDGDLEASRMSWMPPLVTFNRDIAVVGENVVAVPVGLQAPSLPGERLTLSLIEVEPRLATFLAAADLLDGGLRGGFGGGTTSVTGVGRTGDPTDDGAGPPSPVSSDTEGFRIHRVGEGAARPPVLRAPLGRWDHPLDLTRVLYAASDPILAGVEAAGHALAAADLDPDDDAAEAAARNLAERTCYRFTGVDLLDLTDDDVAGRVDATFSHTLEALGIDSLNDPDWGEPIERGHQHRVTVWVGLHARDSWRVGAIRYPSVHRHRFDGNEERVNVAWFDPNLDPIPASTRVTQDERTAWLGHLRRTPEDPVR